MSDGLGLFAGSGLGQLAVHDGTMNPAFYHNNLNTGTMVKALLQVHVWGKKIMLLKWPKSAKISDWDFVTLFIYHIINAEINIQCFKIKLKIREGQNSSILK